MANAQIAWSKKLKDKFRDRKVDVQELGAILRGQRPDISQREVKGIFDEVDLDKTGSLRVSQLVNYIFDVEPPIVLSSPGLDGVASDLRKRLGGDGDSEKILVDWDKFKSGDPNPKYNWRELAGRRIIFLFDTIDQSRLLEQLSLLQALQGFPLPDGDDSKNKWKTYTQTGSYKWGRAAEIAVVVPWYRPCQMERTSRWELNADEAGKKSWTNGDPNGSWLDVPCAQTFTRLLVAPGLPVPGKSPTGALDGQDVEPLWRPPMTLFFIELHEEDPVRLCAEDSHVEVRMEHFVGHFLSEFRKTSHFVGAERTYVLFPDFGGYGRYFEYVITHLGLNIENILWINKKRKADEITQEAMLHFKGRDGETCDRSEFKPDDFVVVIDDFTNSGSTLFGAVNIVRSMVPGGNLAAQIFVSHTVASYDEAALQALLRKLEDCGPSVRFATTDTLPKNAEFLKTHPQVDVYSIVDFLANLLR